MIRIIFLLLSLHTLSHAVNLLEYKINPNDENSLNITFSFDGKFDSKNVIERRSDEALTLILKGVNFAKSEEISVNSPLVSEFLIKGGADTTVAMKTAANSRINLDEINGGTGLMLRVLGENAALMPLNSNSQKSTSLVKYDFTNYLMIMSLLIVLLIVFWWLSRSLKRSKFGGKEFKILFQRPLDKANKFAILEYDSKRYTMILGTSNILLNIEDLGAGGKSGVNSRSEAYGENFGAGNLALDGNLGGAKNSVNSVFAGNSSGAKNSANSALGGNLGILNSTENPNSTQKSQNLDNKSTENLNSKQSDKSTENSSSAKKSEKAKNKDSERNFESFFEENKKRLQNLIKGKNGENEG